MNTDKPKFDLEERTLEYAKKVIRLCKKIPRSPINNRLIDQIIGSSGSIGANYREANDSLGRKDFFCRIKISRKESKETLYWLELIKEANDFLENDIDILIQETSEYKNIFSSILKKEKIS